MSDTPLEKELKYALSAKAHAKLVAALAGPEVRLARQHNFYFDDEDLTLRRQRFGLRVRLVDDAKAILAVKFPPPRDEESHVTGFKVRQEMETPLDLKLARRIAAGQVPIGDLINAPLDKIREVFSAETVAALRPIGDLRTDRTIVPFDSEHKLEIDSCRTLDHVFYELEVETEDPEGMDKRIRKLLAQHDLPYRPLQRSKMARVFKTIRDQQKHLRKEKEPRKRK